MYKHILIPTDGSEVAGAVAQGIEFARDQGARDALHRRARVRAAERGTGVRAPRVDRRPCARVGGKPERILAQPSDWRARRD